MAKLGKRTLSGGLRGGGSRGGPILADKSADLGWQTKDGGLRSCRIGWLPSSGRHSGGPRGGPTEAKLKANVKACLCIDAAHEWSAFD